MSFPLHCSLNASFILCYLFSINAFHHFEVKYVKFCNLPLPFLIFNACIHVTYFCVIIYLYMYKKKKTASHNYENCSLPGILAFPHSLSSFVFCNLNICLRYPIHSLLCPFNFNACVTSFS